MRPFPGGTDSKRDCFLTATGSKWDSFPPFHRDQIKEVVKMLGQMNALDHIITVATEHGIKDIKPLLEAK